MTARAKSASSRRIVQRIAMLAILGGVIAGYGATAWLARGEEKAADKKVKHQPISVMRQRLLQAYHGQTTATFTAIPGFGMKRMPPLYKVVPFEIPDLSTNDVEIEEKIVPPEPLKDVFAKSVDGFHNPAKALPQHKNSTFGRDIGSGWPRSGVVQGGLQLRMLDLVGLVNADGPKVYSGGKAFEVRRMSAEEAKAARLKGPAGPPVVRLLEQAKQEKAVAAAQQLLEGAMPPTRPLDVFETTGVAELRDGKDLFIRTRGNAIRMLGALRATEQCVECHTDSKRGDLLGAFSYTFVDTHNALAKQLEGKSAK